VAASDLERRERGEHHRREEPELSAWRQTCRLVRITMATDRRSTGAS
jgi:hypothetical protein